MTALISAAGSVFDDLAARLEQIPAAEALSMLAWVVAGGAIVLVLWRWWFTLRPALTGLAIRISFLKQVSGPQAFIDQFVDCHALMTGFGVTRHGWSEFVKSFPDQDSDRPTRIEIVVRPGVFLNPASARRNGLGLDGLGTLGRWLIFLGSLATLITLAGAWLAAPETVSADAQAGAGLAVLLALVKLATPGIWAALAWIVAGTVMLAVRQGWSDRLADAFDRLSQELERVTVMITAATILNRSHRELRAQSAAIRRFSEGLPGVLAETLATAMADSAPGGIAAAVERALAAALPQILSEALAPMAASVGDEVGKTVGRELRAVTDALSALPAQMTAAAADVQGAGQTLSQELNRLSDAVNRDVAQTRETLEHQLAAAATGLAQAALAVRNSLEQTGRSLRESAEAAGSAFAVQIGGVAHDLQQASGRSAQDIAATFQEAAATMQTALAGTAGRVETAIDQVRRQIGDLALALDSVETGIGKQVLALDAVTRATRDTEGALSNAAQSLAEAALPLSRTGELLTQTMTTVVRNVETAVRGLTESQRLAGQLATDLKQTTQELKMQRGAAGPANRPPAPWGGSKKP